MAGKPDEIREISMDGFQIVSGDMFRALSRVNLPAITFWYNSVSFSKAAVIALNNCERIRIEVNPKTRCILLIPVTAKDKDAVRWVKYGSEILPRKIECVAFTSQLFESWGWAKNRAYRSTGRIVSADKKIMLFFDFSDPETWAVKDAGDKHHA